jgi:aspartate/methionine/tyrosine aminotransferase
MSPVLASPLVPRAFPLEALHPPARAAKLLMPLSPSNPAEAPPTQANAVQTRFGRAELEARFVADDLRQVPPFFLIHWLELAERLGPSTYEAKGYDLLKLSIGGPTEPPHPLYLNLLSKAAKQTDAHQYAPAQPALKAAFASALQRQAGVEVPDIDQNMVVLNAINTGLAYTLQAVLNQQVAPAEPTSLGLRLKQWLNREVLHKTPAIISPSPEYPTFSSSIHMNHMAKVQAELKPENHFQPDLEALIRQNPGKDIRAAIINYPNNPTGAVASPEYLKQVLKTAKKHHILLLADMAYGYYQPDGVGSPSLFAMAQQLDREEGLTGTDQEKYSDFVLEFWSLSKLGYAGDRIGTALGPPYLIKQLKKYYNLMSGSSSMPKFIQMATTGFLNSEAFTETTQAMKKLYRERYQYTVEHLADLGWETNTQGGPFFYWGPFPKQSGCHSSAEFVEKLMKETGVFLIPGSVFGPEWDGYVRIAMTQPLSVLEEAFKRLKAEGYDYS